MADRVEELASLFSRFPGIGPRQAKRFVYHLLSIPQSERAKFAAAIGALGADVRQCAECYRFWNLPAGREAGETVCTYCSDPSRDDAVLMLIEKDQDLIAVERSGSYRGRYFVLGGVLTLSGKGAIREKELARIASMRAQKGLKEIVLALSATSEGEHTADHIKEVLMPLRDSIKFSMLGRGLATGSELEYVDKETISGALLNRKET